jgi:WD40 repeat protein
MTALTTAAAEPPRFDAQGDPLPAEALARLGTLRFKHGGTIVVLSLSADGKLLATGADDNVIRLWDVASGKLLRRFEKLSAAGAAYSLALAPDGKSLAAPARTGAAAGTPEQVVLWDTATGKQLRRLGEPLDSHCSNLAFSTDGKAVAAGEWDTGKVHVWDAKTGKEIAAWQAHTAQPKFAGSATAVAFAADGKRLVTGGADNGVRPVLVARGGADNVVRLWDAATGTAVRTFVGHTGSIHCFALSPDGRVLATGSADATTRLWEVATGKELHVLPGPGVLAAAFSPDGKTLLTGADGRIHFWEVATGKALRELPGHRGDLTGIAFTPDGKQIISGGQDKVVRVRDAATGRDVHGFPGHAEGLRGVAFSPDGQLLATAGCDRTLRLWSGTKEVRRLTVGAGERGVRDPTFAPDGKALAGTTDTHIHLWDAATGREVRKWEVVTDGITCGLAFAPDGKSLASGGFGTAVRLWDPATGKELRRADGSSRTFSVTFSPDGKMLVAAGGSSQPASLRAWDPDSGKALAGFPQSDYLVAVAFSPGGTLLAGANVEDNTVRLWDVARRKLVRSWKVSDGPFNCCPLAFSRDGRVLVTGSQSPKADNPWDAVHTVRVWEVATGKERCSFRGHDDLVLAVAVSPDGAVIASGSDDTTVLLWDLAGRGPAAVLTAKEMADLWSDLAAVDAARAFSAARRLARSPAQAVALLREKVTPARAADPKQVARLIAALDDNDFEAREKAVAELGRLEETAESALREALRGAPSAEARRRLTDLVARLEGWPPERLRADRALEVLERVGTPPAREVLKALAGGAARARLTKDARAALERLGR